MAFIYIREYNRQPRNMVSGQVAAGMEPGVTTQRIPIGAGSVQSAPFNAQTKFIAINTDATCSLEFGTNPTAAATSMRLPIDGTMYFGVVPGDRVAVITNT